MALLVSLGARVLQLTLPYPRPYPPRKPPPRRLMRCCRCQFLCPGGGLSACAYCKHYTCEECGLDGMYVTCACHAPWACHADEIFAVHIRTCKPSDIVTNVACRSCMVILVPEEAHWCAAYPCGLYCAQCVLLCPSCELTYCFAHYPYHARCRIGDAGLSSSRALVPVHLPRPPRCVPHCCCCGQLGFETVLWPCRYCPHYTCAWCGSVAQGLPALCCHEFHAVEAMVLPMRRTCSACKRP